MCTYLENFVFYIPSVAPFSNVLKTRGVLIKKKIENIENLMEKELMFSFHNYMLTIIFWQFSVSIDYRDLWFYSKDSVQIPDLEIFRKSEPKKIEGGVLIKNHFENIRGGYLLSNRWYTFFALDLKKKVGHLFPRLRY